MATNSSPDSVDQPDASTEELVRGETLTGGLSRTNRILMLGAVLVLLALVVRTCA